MSSTDRSELEIRALMRKRNAAVLRYGGMALTVAFAVISVMNVFTAASIHKPSIVSIYILAGFSEFVLALTALSFALILPRLARRFATCALGSLLVTLVAVQAFMLHLSADHPGAVILAEFIGIGVLFHMPFRRALVFFPALFLIPAAFSWNAAIPIAEYLPPILPGPVIGLMAAYLQNNTIRQSLEIRRNNRALSRSNQRTETALREIQRLKGQQDLILDTVKEGLFLIDPELGIDSQYSAAFPSIVGRTQPGSMLFPELVRMAAGENAGEEIERYLRLQFQSHIAAIALVNLNPLDEVSFDTADGVRRILNFRFTRVIREGAIVSLLAAVEDVTDRRALEMEIQRRESAELRRMQLIFRLVEIDTALLRPFLTEVRNTLKTLRDLLEAKQDTYFFERLVRVFRYVHSLKGNAGVLKLEIFEMPAHAFETEIERALEHTNTNTEMLLSHLEILEATAGEVDTIITQLSSFRDSFAGVRSVGDLLIESLESLVLRLANDLQRPIQFEHHGFDRTVVDPVLGAILRDVLVQLARNAVVHGIESPEDRATKNKPRSGMIQLVTNSEGESLRITLRDDGRGLQLAKIQQKAIADGRLAANQTNAVSPAELAEVIFEPGFTTAEEVSLHAGRGIGLDLVRSRLDEIGGSIAIDFRADEYSEFTITLPRKSAAGEHSTNS